MRNFLRRYRLKIKRRSVTKKASEKRLELLELTAELGLRGKIDQRLQRKLKKAMEEVELRTRLAIEVYERNEPLLEELLLLIRNAARSASNYGYMHLPDKVRDMESIRQSLAWQQSYYVNEMHLMDDVLEEEQQAEREIRSEIKQNDLRRKEVELRLGGVQRVVESYGEQITLLDEKIKALS